MAIKDNSKLNIPLVGLLAVKNLLVTKEDLQKGLSSCAGADDPGLALKEYFLSNELVSSQNMERLSRAAKALDLRQKEIKFGAIAIRKGFINQSVFKLALEEQESDFKGKKKIRLVGDMLVEAGMLTEKHRDYILKLQNRIGLKNKAQPLEKKNKDLTGDGKTVEKEAGVKEEENGLLKPEVITGGIKLEIARDLMAAFFSKTEAFNDNITLEQIKETLIDKGIVLGIAKDKMIEGFINSSGFKTKSFRIAKGISPIQGKDAKVEFFFNTDYLNAGGMTKDGTIDFKDRGEVPHIEEGTVLAEKIPMIESRRGHNIYGDEIETLPGNDIVLKIGKGAKLSEDGFKVISDVKGFPKYALSGHIFVHQVYITEGDVDYETGHINYDGNVDIKGRIKSGFKVKGNDIDALEVDGGIVNADGNVIVAGGINEGKIYARGNVYAKFIHKSEIVCMGDVVVAKEIVDSDIQCSGNCVIETGTFISSRIAAKMGVKARNIGTEKTEPNIIRVGLDAFTKKELGRNQEKLDKLTKQIELQKEKKEKLKEQNITLQKQITELAHVQDRSQLEEKEINSKISLIENEESDAVYALKKKIEELKKTVQMAEKKLDDCFDKSEQIEEVIKQKDKDIRALGKRQTDFMDERTNLIKWAKENPGKAVVIAEGAIMPETVVFGQHSEKRITELMRHAKIMEVLCTSDDGKSLNIYEMQVGNI